MICSSFKSTLRVLFDLLKDDKGLLKALKMLRFVVLGQFERYWVPSQVTKSSSENCDLSDLALHVHVFHEKYIARVVELVSTFESCGKIVVTSPKENLLAQLKAVLPKVNNVSLVAVKNVGRNFGALVQVMHLLESNKYLLHLHSKSSPHMSNARSNAWSDLYWDKLGQLDTAKRIINAFEQDHNISLAYPELSSVLPSRSFSWGRNRDLAKAIMPGIEFPGPKIRFPYPAGGMFIIRTSFISKIIASVGIDDLPHEPLAIDGTLAHALERLVGAYPIAMMQKHLIITRQNLLTTDTSFINFRGRWG